MVFYLWETIGKEGVGRIGFFTAFAFVCTYFWSLNSGVLFALLSTTLLGGQGDSDRSTMGRK